MKQVLCLVGLSATAFGHQLEHKKEASSFLRSRREAPADDPNVMNIREEWENFKDSLESLEIDAYENDIDNLETCIASCRKRDWGWGVGFSELKEQFNEGELKERPLPCPECCSTIPPFVYTEPDQGRNNLINYGKVFYMCKLPKCVAGEYGNANEGVCSACPAGSFSEAASTSCQECPANTFSETGSESCTTCSAGSFSAKGAAECSANVCVCDNGVAASGESCAANGDVNCASCDAGFHGDGDECVANSCYCNDGEAADGEDCSSDDAEICAACDQGFYLDGNQCVAHICECDNGAAYSGADCGSGNEGCASCDAGFHLVDTFCIANECHCSRGIAASGAACSEHKQAQCASCNTGYHLSGELCYENQCTCENGEAATGADCPNDGDAVCVANGCDSGFLFSAGGCAMPAGPSEGEARIVAQNSAHSGTGRLEVFWQGEWGTVCNDDFDDKDAMVACRMMGYTHGRTVSNANTVNGAPGQKIWLDNLKCDGSESDLFDCKRGPANWKVGMHNCDTIRHSEDIGVACFH